MSSTVCTSTFSFDGTTDEDVISVISVVTRDNATHRMRKVVLEDDFSSAVAACVNLTQKNMISTLKSFHFYMLQV